MGAIHLLPRFARGIAIALALLAGASGATQSTRAATAAAAQAATPGGVRPLAADSLIAVDPPRTKAQSLDAPSFVDPVYGTAIYKMTDASDYPGATYVRHEYSRRQVFNADNSRFLATTSNGYWLLYDATTFRVLRRRGNSGALSGMAGDAEPIWHPTDPRKLWYTTPENGLVWYEKDVESDRDSVMADFTGRLPWKGVRSVWTKGEGTSSADGRYWAFMATAYDGDSKTNQIFGLFTYDRVEDRIIGTLDAAAFGGAFPDHISISPSGRFAVPGWAYNKQLGTRAYPLDFSTSRLLHEECEHSDLALGADGADYLVFADYGSGQVRATRLEDGRTFNLLGLYPRSGAAFAVHISGKAFDRPGWVLLSSYDDSAEYGAARPDPKLEAPYRKLMLLELKPDGRKLSLAQTQTGRNYGDYWGEPQASISRDGLRAVFASNFDGRAAAPASFMVRVPEAVYAAAPRP